VAVQHWDGHFWYLCFRWHFSSSKKKKKILLLALAALLATPLFAGGMKVGVPRYAFGYVEVLR
jgi:hypothetical protein